MELLAAAGKGELGLYGVVGGTAYIIRLLRYRSCDMLHKSV